MKLGNNIVILFLLLTSGFVVIGCEARAVASTGTGFIYAVTSPSEANIYIDGVFKGLTPKKIKLDVGTHNVKFTKTGYVDYVTDAVVYQGKTTRVEATLIPVSATTTTTTMSTTTTTTSINQTTTTLPATTTTTLSTTTTTTLTNSTS